MPRHTQHCTHCDWVADIFVAAHEHPACPICHSATERLWSGRSASVAQDSWEGGKTFENLGNDPVTLYSRSELKRELKERGLEECVRHVPVPGTDKSPHTTNWDVPSEYALRQAKILLERVGTVTVPSKSDATDPAIRRTVEQVMARWH